MAPGKRPPTYRDLTALPAHVVGEILDGELYASPRPRPAHAITQCAIPADLVPPYQHGRGGPGGWLIMIEPELHLGRQIVVPDVAGWRARRLRDVPNRVGITVAPDWICEVLSPTTAHLDRGKKLRTYREHGVKHAWLVDPILRSVEVYRRAPTAWTLRAVAEGDQRVQLEPFAAVTIDLAAWWAPWSKGTTASERIAAYGPPLEPIVLRTRPSPRRPAAVGGQAATR